MRFISTGTHPTAHYQWIARRLLIFGLRVQIGMPDPETCIVVQNELLRDLGLLLALSTSSPYWQGEITGLASSRVTVFEAMPTGGSPILLKNWDEFSSLVATLQKAHAITSLKDLWWDIRPSPRDGTLEIRVCDGLASIRETCAIGVGAPTSADHQRALYERTQRFFAVTRALADEFEDDLLAGIAASDQR